MSRRASTGPVQLSVISAPASDVFADVARLDISHRPFAKAGRVIRIRCGKRVALAVARGTPKGGKNFISLDSATRAKLGIKANETAIFEFEEALLWDDFVWAWYATDAMPRIAARLGLVSLVLGLVGLLLGALPLF